MAFSVSVVLIPESNVRVAIDGPGGRGTPEYPLPILRHRCRGKTVAQLNATEQCGQMDLQDAV